MKLDATRRPQVRRHLQHAVSPLKMDRAGLASCGISTAGDRTFGRQHRHAGPPLTVPSIVGRNRAVPPRPHGAYKMDLTVHFVGRMLGPVSPAGAPGAGGTPVKEA